MDSHNDMQGLAPGFVLLALDPNEERAFRLHLATCRECSREVADLRAILDTLPETIAQREPPARLRELVLAAAVAHQEAAPAVPPREERQTKEVRWRTSQRRRLPAWPAVATTAVAVALVAVTVTGFLAMRTRQSTTQVEARLAESYEALRIMAASDSRWQVAGNAAAPRATGVLAYSGQKNASSMVLWGLSLDPGRKYVAWTVTDGKRSPVGPMWRADNGLWIVIPGDARKMEGIGVTLKTQDAPADFGATDVIYVNMADLEPTVQMGWQD